MKTSPLRIDFIGGWLDVPKLSMSNAYIVNCTFIPGVSDVNWPYQYGGGLGGSAAKAILEGKDPLESELNTGAGWQDPAVLLEGGLCVWRSGQFPILDFKVNPDFIENRIYLYWTGKPHVTADLVEYKRDYGMIKSWSKTAKIAVREKQSDLLWECVEKAYGLQLEEGMDKLPVRGEICKKYCGSGHGGYAFYIDPTDTKDMERIYLCM